MRIVDQDHVGPAPGQHPADRGRHPEAAPGRDQLAQRRPRGAKAGWEQSPVPGGRHQRAAIAGEGVGKVLRVSGVDDGERRVVAEQPGRKRDRGGQRLQMPGRDVDDEPPRPALAHGRQPRRHDFDMPAGDEGRRAVAVDEGVQQERIEVVAQSSLDLGRCEAFPPLIRPRFARPPSPRGGRDRGSPSPLRKGGALPPSPRLRGEGWGEGRRSSPRPACGERAGVRGGATPHPAGSRFPPLPCGRGVGGEGSEPERCVRESPSPANRRRSSAITIASASLASPSGRPPSDSLSARSSALMSANKSLVARASPFVAPSTICFTVASSLLKPPDPPVRLLDRNPLAQRPGDNRAEMALHPRPPARVARLAGPEPRRDRRPARAGALPIVGRRAPRPSAALQRQPALEPASPRPRALPPARSPTPPCLSA